MASRASSSATVGETCAVEGSAAVSGIRIPKNVPAADSDVGYTVGVSAPVTPAKRPPSRPLPLKSLNHVSIHCRDVKQSLRFYRDLMGFIPVKRPTCLDYFDGAWLFNYGLGIHLLKVEDEHEEGELNDSPAKINPRSDHVSFQCDDVNVVESVLKEHGIAFVRQTVEENGIIVEQLFFHDPDHHMIEICNCDALPVVPLQDSSPSPAALRQNMRDPGQDEVLSLDGEDVDVTLDEENVRLSVLKTSSKAAQAAAETSWQSSPRSPLVGVVDCAHHRWANNEGVRRMTEPDQGYSTGKDKSSGLVVNIVSSSEGRGNGADNMALEQLKRKVQRIRLSGCGGSCSSGAGSSAPAGSCPAISSLVAPGGHVASISPARRFSSPGSAHAALCQLCLQSMRGTADADVPIAAEGERMADALAAATSDDQCANAPQVLQSPRTSTDAYLTQQLVPTGA